MKKEKYNWWTDPKNKETVDEYSWWEHEENKETFNFPISVIREDDIWVATCNSETKKLIGDKLHAVTQGKTKEEAITTMFRLMGWLYEHSEQEVLNYQRFVPFRKGDWDKIGGKWFVIFGIQVYFRYGKGMKGGRYIPFTKLNISISNYWSTYKRYKKNTYEQSR